MAVVAPAQAALTPSDFLASPGAQAFRAGDFDSAVSGFESLRSAHPDDPLVMRYLAMSYDRVGRSDEAIALFEEALAIQPDNPALYFFLGVAHWNARQGDAATPAFQRTLALAPDSPYGEKARAYLDALATQSAALQTQGATRDWRIDIQGGVQYDTNVNAGPSGFATADIRAYEVLDAGYSFLQSGGLELRGDFFSYFSQHARGASRDFDAQIFEPSLEASYSTEVIGLPVTGSVTYAFNVTLLDTDHFSHSHEVTTALRLQPFDDGLTKLSHTFSYDEFDNDGFTDSISSRDGFVNRFGVTQYLFCCGRDLYFFGGAEYQLHQTEGDNFDMQGVTVSAGASASLPLDFRFDLQASHTWENYHNFVGTNARDGQRTGVNAAVTHEVTDYLDASINYGFVNETSSINFLGFKRHVVGGALNLNF